MLGVRVIPNLLLRNGGLVKGSNFKNHKYVGDPINAVKIFNEKEVDELVFLDIGAGISNEGPNFNLLEDIASEAFIPFSYGGGITRLNEIDRLFRLGVEKVILNTAAINNPTLIEQAVRIHGSQSIVVSMDVRKSFWGKYEIYSECATVNTKLDPVEFAQRVEALGAGEIILCAADREGKGVGFDCALIQSVVDAVGIPVVGSGGAGALSDLSEAVRSTGVRALAVGNLFTFHGRHKAVLITYPGYTALQNLFLDG